MEFKMVSRASFRLRWNFIKGIFASRAYVLLFAVFLSSYLGVNYWLNGLYETLPGLLGFRLPIVVPYLAGTFFIGLLVAVNLTIIVYKLRQALSLGREVGVTTVGMVGGMLGGACPGCFVGIFPAVAGLFGVTATLSSLPFLGFEILIPTLLLMIVALYLVAKPLTCPPDMKAKKGKRNGNR